MALLQKAASRLSPAPAARDDGLPVAVTLRSLIFGLDGFPGPSLHCIVLCRSLSQGLRPPRHTWTSWISFSHLLHLLYNVDIYTQSDTMYNYYRL